MNDGVTIFLIDEDAVLSGQCFGSFKTGIFIAAIHNARFRILGKPSVCYTYPHRTFVEFIFRMMEH
jgi:hypothetical protein